MYSMHDGMDTSIHLEVAERLNPSTCVEVGTYYGGITYKLCKALPHCHFFAVQAYHDHKLNHMPDTIRGEYSQGVADKTKSINLDPSLKNQDWKRAVAQNFPPEYHDYFDFNLLVKTFQDCNNVSIILDTSPFKWQFPEVDLTIFDLSPLLEENIKQYEFWKNKSKNILVGAYNHQQEFIDYAGGAKMRKDYVLV
tara:strand:- start:18989 stop:19573 length:585 start_codon:yes stop_codon:yes gene_type:complete